ncbi:MAG: tetratricopeptide repeat protein [Nitrospira sp.]|nr:tetratricopeptide repeat protein [Nitrospira sp.]
MVTNLRTFLPLITLCAAAATTYAGAFRGGFHYDDSLSILQNSHLDSWQTFMGHLDHMVRPVLYATFLFDRSLYGGNPIGYHLLNLLLHLGSGLLIYRILSSAITDEHSSVPFWTALLFLLHPIATESVTYISGRASSLMAFFYLLALFLYITAPQETRPRKPHGLYLSVSVASFVLAIGSKETAVTLPVVLLLWDISIRRLRGPQLRTALLSSHSPFWIVLLLAAGWAWSHPRYAALAQFSFDIRPFRDHVFSQVHTAAYAIALCFTPWNQNFDHDLPLFRSLTQWPLPLDLLFLSAMAAGAFVARRQVPLATFGVAWFLVQFLPTSLIPRNDLLSERNLYLPAIGLLLAGVALVSYLIHRIQLTMERPALVRVGSSILATAMIASLGLLTYQRNLLYHDRLLLWSDAVAKSPNKARPHNNLGYAYALRDDWDRAIEEFRKAARLDPDFLIAQQNLRDAYLHHVGRQ